MQLILHIGTPKTGSTALQEALIQLTPALQKRGILHPLLRTKVPNHSFLTLLTGNDEHMSGLFRYFIRKDPKYLTHKIPRAWNDLEAQIRKSRPRKLILSSEMLFSVLVFDTNNLLRDRLLSLSRDIRLVAYFRRPSHYYLSHAQEMVKYSSALPLPAPMNIRQHVELWERSMNCSLTAVCYDRSELIGGDVTTDFLHRVLDEDERAGLDVPRITSNESISAEAMEILQDYKRIIHPDSGDERFEDHIALRRALIALEQKTPPPQKAKLRAEIADAVDYSSVELLWLRDRYGVSFPGIDYARVSRVPAPDFSACPRVSELCAVDPDRKAALYACAVRHVHDTLAKELALRKKRQRSLFGWLR